jgi:hypothetical protein
MSTRACPHCARRLPFAGRRCIHCDWCVDSEHTAGAGIAWYRRTRVWAGALTVAALFTGQFAARNSERVADWYAGFAARFLPEAASSFAPSDTEPGAFFYCARQVSKKMDGEFSVETFDEAGSRTVPLGEGRYRIESVVDQARQSGEQVRHDFSCTVRFTGGRWMLEELKVQPDATPRAQPPTLARQP